jgi:secondary thiamine-phosphate synthase enzyme
MIELTIQSKEHTAFIPITERIQNILDTEGWKNGVLTIFIPHTTAAVTIQESADPDVILDMKYALEKAAPWDDPEYAHAEGNTGAHVKSAMLGTSAQCIVQGGKIKLGKWQGIFFCEFDGPRSRHIWLTFHPEMS